MYVAFNSTKFSYLFEINQPIVLDIFAIKQVFYMKRMLTTFLQYDFHLQEVLFCLKGLLTFSIGAYQPPIKLL